MIVEVKLRTWASLKERTARRTIVQGKWQTNNLPTLNILTLDGYRSRDPTKRGLQFLLAKDPNYGYYCSSSSWLKLASGLLIPSPSASLASQSPSESHHYHLVSSWKELQVLEKTRAMVEPTRLICLQWLFLGISTNKIRLQYLSPLNVALQLNWIDAKWIADSIG